MKNHITRVLQTLPKECKEQNVFEYNQANSTNDELRTKGPLYTPQI